MWSCRGMLNLKASRERPFADCFLSDRLATICTLLVLALCCFGRAVSARPDPLAPGISAGFVGDASCSRCHAGYVEKYETTSHRRTLQPATQATILGSFATPTNRFRTLDPSNSLLGDGLEFHMRHIQSRFFETALSSEYQDLTRATKVHEHTESIDLVVGSGVRGQSYLSWKDDTLYQLPVSFWTATHEWINSPGYPDGSAIFNRVATPRCLECHTTFAHFVQGTGDPPHLDRSSLVQGITCERCHGPGASHVSFHSITKTASTPIAGDPIVNPRRLSREQQVDLCALCHNGTGRPERRPAFSFQVGDSLDDFFGPDPVEHRKPEVHGDQVGLLKMSRCYRESRTMTCSTCHNEHDRERPAEAYTAKCLSCHTVASCPQMRNSEAHAIRGGCIACHMPVQSTDAIVSTTAGAVVRAKMRTHLITVYPSAEVAQPLNPGRGQAAQN